jgi:O-antigen/teichoic acid export membrane protein
MESTAATPPEVPAPPDSRELDRSLVRGIAWTGASKWATQLIRWGSTLAIARLLSQGDYGIVGMAMVYLGLVQLVNEFGLSAAIIQHRDLDTDQIARLAGLSVLLGFGFAALSLVLSPLFAYFFSEPLVQAVIAVLAVTFILRAFQVVPRAILNRDLRFRQLAVLDSVEAIVQAVAALVLALMHTGYWALVFGSIAGIVASTILALVMHRHRIAWPNRLASIREAVTFGGQNAGARVAWYVYSNADFAIVGRVLGKSALGAYSIGWTLANIPVERVAALVGRVTPAIFSAVQNDTAALRRYVLRITEGLALLTFPAAVGLSLVTDDFVLGVLGEKWRSAIVPLQLLSFYGGFRSVTTLLPQVLVARNRARTNMMISIVAAIILPIAFLIGTRWGTAGVATAWLIGFPVIIVPFYLFVAFREIHLTAGQYLGSLWPAASGLILMAAAVLGVRAAMSPEAPHLVRLFTAAGAGAIAYLLVMVLLHRERIRTAIALLRRKKAA